MIGYLLSTLFYTAMLFLVSVGLALIFGIMRILNLAHGSFFALGAYMTASLVEFGFAHELPAIALLSMPIISAIIVGVIGIGLEFGLLKRIYQRELADQLLITFGIVLIFEGLLLSGWGYGYKSAYQLYEILGTLNIMGTSIPTYIFVPVLATSVIMLLLLILLFRTRMGRLLRAVSTNARMCSALGVNVSSIYSFTFLVATILGGLGGSLTIPMIVAYPGISLEVLIMALAVIIIGGLRSLKGALVGSFIVGSLRSVGVALFPEIAMAVIFLVVIATLLIRPYGLFGIPE